MYDKDINHATCTGVAFVFVNIFFKWAGEGFHCNTSTRAKKNWKKNLEEKKKKNQKQ